MALITDFSKISQQRIFEENLYTERFVFKFTIPYIQNPNDIFSSENHLSGFQLLREGVVVDQQLLSSVTTSTGLLSSTGYLTYDASDMPGEVLDFQIRSVDLDATIYILSNLIIVETFPDAVAEITTNYQTSGEVTISWEPVTTSPQLQYYTLVRSRATQFKISDTFIESIDLTSGNLIITFSEAITTYIRVVYQKYSWSFFAINTATVILTNDDLEAFSNTDLNYLQIGKTGVEIYYPEFFEDIKTISTSTGLDVIETSTGITTSTGLHHTTDLPPAIEEARYIYGIRTEGLTVSESNYIALDDVHIQHRNPELLPWQIQSDSTISNQKWENIKKVLVDSNYYNKNYYAIPYKELDSDNNGFTFDGFVNAGNESIEVYINGRLRETILSTSTGYFSFNFQGRLNKNTVRLTTNTVNQSRKSTEYAIYMYRIYSHFSVLANETKRIEDDLDTVHDNFFIDTCDADNIEPNFASQIGLKFSSSIDETLEEFRNVTKWILSAHLEFGLRSSFEKLMNAFTNYYTTYTFFEKDSNLHSIAPAYAKIASDPHTFRGNYAYGVSALTSTNGETAVSTITTDKRWWPFFFKNGISMKWDAVIGAEKYAIYRGTSESTLRRIITTSGGLTSFLDNGTLLSSTGVLTSIGEAPYTFNFTNTANPSNFQETKVSVNLDNFFPVRRRTSVTLAITTEIDPFPDLILNRIYSYASFAIAPLKLRVVIGSDKYIILKETDESYILFAQASQVVESIESVDISPSDWVATGDYYTYDFNHNLGSLEIIPRAYILESAGDETGISVVPGFTRTSDNQMRIHWNNNTDILRVQIIKLVED